MRKLLCVVLLAVAATPVSAHAAVPIGSEPASHPVAVGQEVVWVRKGEDLGKGAAVFEIVATKLDGSSRVLATTPRPTATHDLEPTVTPFASPERLAYLRTDYVREGKYQYPTQDSIRLFDGPSPEPLAACGRFGRMSAAVAGRALVYTNCEATRLVVDEPGTPRREIAQPRTVSIDGLEAAGRFAAVHRSGDGPPELVVYDLDSGREVLKLTTATQPSAFARSFDVQADGKLLVAWYDGRARDRLTWVSPGDRRTHDVFDYPAALESKGIHAVKVDDDRAAALVSDGCRSFRWQIAAGPLDGDIAQVTEPGELAESVDLDGGVVAWKRLDAGIFARDLLADPAGAPVPGRDCTPRRDEAWQLTGQPQASSAERSLTVTRATVRVPVYCVFHTVGGPPGSHCRGWIRIETRVRRGRGRLLGLREVSLGPALERPRVRLNSAGRALLRRKRSLPVRVIASGRRDPRSGFFADDMTLRASR